MMVQRPAYNVLPVPKHKLTITKNSSGSQALHISKQKYHPLVPNVCATSYCAAIISNLSFLPQVLRGFLDIRYAVVIFGCSEVSLRSLIQVLPSFCPVSLCCSVCVAGWSESPCPQEHSVAWPPMCRSCVKMHFFLNSDQPCFEYWKNFVSA